MLTFKGERVQRLAIWFLDGLAVAAESNLDELLTEKAFKYPLSYDWFDIFVLIEDNEPARLWKADIVAASFKDEYICRMVADFWCNQTSAKPYWRSWWVDTNDGRYNHEFTCHHQSDAAAAFNRRHPGVRINSISGKDRVYLSANIRHMVDSDPFGANQPVASLLQFDNVS